MAHIVPRKRGKHTYYYLEESYRDEKGRPRKRQLKKYGKVNPLLYAFGIPNIDWANAFKCDPGVSAAERAMEKANTDAEARERAEEQRQAFIDHEHAIKVFVERSEEIAKLIDEYDRMQFSAAKDASPEPSTQAPEVSSAEQGPSEAGSNGASGS